MVADLLISSIPGAVVVGVVQMESPELFLEYSRVCMSFLKRLSDVIPPREGFTRSSST